MTVKDVYDLIDGYAPFSSQCEWDNSGILLVDADADVKGVLVALDVTKYLINLYWNMKLMIQEKKFSF